MSRHGRRRGRRRARVVHRPPVSPAGNPGAPVTVATLGPVAPFVVGFDLDMTLADRERYVRVGVDGTTALPGAVEALGAVRREGGRSVVVTDKSTALATAMLRRLDLAADDVVGGRWGPGKGEVLAERRAVVHVGDRTADMTAARAVGAAAVAVTSGADTASDLTAAGADVVLSSLHEFPAWLSRYLLPQRLTALHDRLVGLDSVLVAFSGGADSAFLLAAAVRALGAERVVAATATSPSLPDRELAGAREFAAGLGVRHETPTTRELDREGYVANAGDRCAFCKGELLDVLTPLAAGLGLRHVATGTNADDVLAGFRPGIAAASRRGAVTPLFDAGLTKPQVRQASREWGLATWDKPAAACLASRIAYGVPVTAQRLARVERAETSLRLALDAAGFAVRDLRVRDLGGVARVEVDPALVPTLQRTPALVTTSVEGFDAVEIDERGFRSGAMNEQLPDADRWR